MQRGAMADGFLGARLSVSISESTTNRADHSNSVSNYSLYAAQHGPGWHPTREFRYCFGLIEEITRNLSIYLEGLVYDKGKQKGERS